MNPNDAFNAAIETTKVIKKRQSSLFTFGITKLPYYFIAQSEIDPHDTVTREGKVNVEKPQIYIPGYNPQFQGFEFEDDISMDEDELKYILLTRRIILPSLRYIHSEKNLTVERVSLDEKVNSICNQLDRKSDTGTAVIRGKDKFFPFPLLIYVGEMIFRSTGSNLTDIFEKGGGLGL
jgi:hypothetical protein